MKNIAILVPGGFGAPHSGRYIPALHSMIALLSEHANITVFCPIERAVDIEPPQCGMARVQFVQMSDRSSIFRKVFLLSRSFASEHRRRSFDCVHGFWALPAGLTAVILGIFYRLPRIVSLQGGELVSLRSLRYGNMLKPSSRIVTRWICRNATFLTVLTHFQRQQLAQWDIERPDSIVIPYGTPASQFPFSRKEIQQRPIRLLHIGNLNPVKDQITLLRAFALIAHQVDARLRIVGEDHMDGALQEKARSLNIEDKIEFYGYVQYRELPAHYSWAHFLLHSSLHEAQAVVISEALSSGVVVVGTNVGLVADLDGRGTTAVPVGDYSGLAAKVLQFLEKPESYLEQAELGKAWADKHDIAWTVNEFSDLYQRLSADKHAPAGFQPLRDSLDPRKVSSELTKEVLTRDRS